MDPNETLRLLRNAIDRGHSLTAQARRLCDEANESGQANDEFAVREQAAEAFAEAAEYAEALDDWLKQGGFLPTDWQHPGR